MRHFALATLLLVIATSAAAAPKDDLDAFRVAVKTARAAYQAKDWPAAAKAFETARHAAPQRPAVLYNLAAIAARRGDARHALQLLTRAAASGVHYDPAADDDFAPLKSTPAFAKIAARFAANAKPLCRCAPFFTGTSAPFIAEGLAVDGKRLLVASIRTRRIVTIENGRMTDFVAALPDGLSPFGMAADRAHNTLWVAAGSVPQNVSTPHTAALLAFDLATGALKSSYTSPDPKAVFGDVARGPDGALYVSDSIAGGLYRLAPNAAALETFSDAFVSPQGMVVSTDKTHLIVADYAMGLIALDLKTRGVKQITVPPNVTTVTIDGLVRHGDVLLATQNGIAPPRILKLRVSNDGTRLTAATVLAATSPTSDPSLIASDGHTAYAVAVSQWSSFDDDKPDPARPTAPWQIIKLTQ